MAGEAVKSLGQAYPAANTLTTLDTVPGATQHVVSSLIVCNQGDQPGTFRVSKAVAGAADEAKQYLYYDEPIGSKRAFAITLGITLAATDVVRVLSSNGRMSFNLEGSEIT